MTYQVLARKWRPQIFEEVVGQNAAAETLRNAISNSRIAHAYLFAGVRGVGKTTTARILAKALNCQSKQKVDPCNECSSCREITLGQSIDVLELDAASNRGIDEIRELRESVKYAPARDPYKIFIIDEVHMLTTEAFNALLKTLEEPPPQIVFILATTELQKIPGTILSRCQHFNFRAISYQDILKRLEFIATQEHIQIGPQALNLIAKASEGSMRDAQSVLDQVISLCGQKIDDEKVTELLGAIPRQLLENFAETIVESDSKKGLLIVEQLVKSGKSPQQCIREMLGYFRDLLVLKIAGKDSELIAVPMDDLKRLEAVSSNFSEQDLMRFCQILVATEGELRWSTQPRIHLEMAFVKIIQLKHLVAIEEFLSSLPNGIDLNNNEVAVKTDTLSEQQSLKPQISNGQTNSVSSTKNTDIDVIRIALKTASPKIDSIIDRAIDFSVEKDEIRIRFLSSDSHYKDMIDIPDNLKVIQNLGVKLIGKPYRVSLTSSGNNDASTLPSGTITAPTSRLPVKVLDRSKKGVNVRQFLNVLEGEIRDIKKMK